MILRSINVDMNESAIERIRVTFDEIVGNMDIPFHALETGERPWTNIPEGLIKSGPVKDKEGDLAYGLDYNGVETIAVYQALGWVLFGRDGSFGVPDGMEELDPIDIHPLDERYDYWYGVLGEYLKSDDMPDKIPEPEADEIDVEAGFGDADVDGAALDSED